MRLLRTGTLAATCLIGAACGLDTLNSVLEPVTGTGQVYTLVSVNGKAIPAVVVEGQSQLEVRKGALTLQADSVWILSYVLRASGAGSDQSNVQSFSGSYSVADTAIQLIQSGDSVAVFTGTYSTTDVSLLNVSVQNGDRWIFHR